MQDEQRQFEKEFGQQAQMPPRPEKPKMSLGAALAQLALVGLASPFLDLGADPFHGMIGLVILAVGIRIAWQLTAGRPFEILGPFDGQAAAT